jgi:hypothetical protein
MVALSMVVALARKENGMFQMKIFGPITLGLLVFLAASGDRTVAASTAGTAQSATGTCRKAEVNPVTGHVFCFDPIGAPVEAPPAAAEVPCRADAHSNEARSWSPKCKPEGRAKPAPDEG